MVKIGLVLSGGGARGFAHIGVLKVLTDNGIKISAISGCSIGALFGACYCTDQNPYEIEKQALTIKGINDVFDFSLPIPSTGLAKGEKIEKYIKKYLKKENFEDLIIHLHVNAVDINSEKEMVFTKGKLLPALRASMSFPGVFSVKRINGKMYIDGGFANPLPFQSLHDVDYLILVDVSELKLNITEKSGLKDVVVQSMAMMQHKLVEETLAHCYKKHILIEPNVNNIGTFDFKHLKETIEEGAKATKAVIDKIKKDIELLHKIDLKE